MEQEEVQQETQQIIDEKSKNQNVQQIGEISTKQIRQPSYVGSWYSGNSSWAYKFVKPIDKMRVFLLAPAHYVFLRNCAIPTNTKIYQTPLGDIEIDQETLQKLLEDGTFDILDKDADEQENSIELQLPFIKKYFGNHNIKLIPVLVGQLNQKQEQYYAQIFTKYFDEDDTLFIISSDFCHWGNRYNYTYQEQEGEIYENIEKLDQKGIAILEAHDYEQFQEYLTETKNTICGKYILSMMLRIISQSKNNNQLITKFIRYAQSFPIIEKEDFCISFAAGITFID